MKILLINPPIISLSEPWYDTPMFTRTALAYLAASIIHNTEHEVQIIDAKFERIGFEDTIKKVVDYSPDIVGVTAFTNEIKPAAYLCGLIKNYSVDIKTIIGGVHITAIPEQTMEEFWSFDIGVFGEGEITIVELLDAINNKESLYNIPGVIFREGNTIIKNVERGRNLNLDNFPLPAWHLMPNANVYHIQTQRGCPLNCNFCMNPNGRFARKRSVENIIKEINFLINDMGAKHISFGDELFSVDLEHTHKLLDAMIDNQIGQKVTWDVQTHVRYVNYELFLKFKKANVERVELGVESGDENILRKMGKGTSIKMIKDAFNAAKRARVSTGSFFLLGQPFENKNTINETIKFAVKLNPDLPMFGIMTPYPGTQVCDMALKGEGGYKLLSYDWDVYNKQFGGALELERVKRHELEYLQVKGYLLVFLYNYRFFSLIKFIWTYKEGAISLLKKWLGIKNNKSSFKKPEDYEKLIYKYKTPNVKLNNAFDYWKNIQKKELSRAKDNKK